MKLNCERWRNLGIRYGTFILVVLGELVLERAINHVGEGSFARAREGGVAAGLGRVGEFDPIRLGRANSERGVRKQKERVEENSEHHRQQQH